MYLSILVPSKRPVELQRFLGSAIRNAHNIDTIEFVIGIDHNSEEPSTYTGAHVKVIKVPPKQTMSFYDESCYKFSSGDWVMFCNDDVIVETKDWDEKIRQKTAEVPDGIAVLWPNDNMFGQALSCFPIVSRKVIESVNLFPMPYKRYKIDDTIFDLFPPDRRIYLQDVKFTHNNDQGVQNDKPGYRFQDGRIYPIDQEAGAYDQALWLTESKRRNSMKGTVATMLGLKAVKLPEGFKCFIAVPTMEFARQAIFYDNYNQIQKPLGTICGFAHGQSPAYSRNLMIQQALDTNCTHILFIDDDVLVKPDVLIRLASHDKDVVSGLYCMRNYPHTPIIFDEALDDGRCRNHLLSDGENGLIPIVNAGLGLILMKLDMFRKLEKPWIRLGQIDKDQWCDDIEFFNRVRAAGYKMFCDLECIGGHMATAVIWPHYNNGTWETQYDTNGPARVSFPQMKLANAVQEVTNAVA